MKIAEKKINILLSLVSHGVLDITLRLKNISIFFLVNKGKNTIKIFSLFLHQFNLFCTCVIMVLKMFKYVFLAVYFDLVFLLTCTMCNPNFNYDIMGKFKLNVVSNLFNFNTMAVLCTIIILIYNNG